MSINEDRHRRQDRTITVADLADHYTRVELCDGSHVAQQRASSPGYFCSTRIQEMAYLIRESVSLLLQAGNHPLLP